MSAWTPPSPDTIQLARNLRQLAEERLSREKRILLRRRPNVAYLYYPPVRALEGDALWWVSPTLWGIAGLFAFSFSDQLSQALVRAFGL